MRRYDREILPEKAWEVVDSCPYAVISMASDNMPYAVPLSIVRDKDVIYFHCAHNGEKIDILRKNPNATMICVDDVKPIAEHYTTEYKSAMLRGTLKEVTDDEEKIHALRLICLRYAASNMEMFDSAIEKSLARTAIWKMKVEEITGKMKKYDAHGKEIKFTAHPDRVK